MRQLPLFARLLSTASCGFWAAGGTDVTPNTFVLDAGWHPGPMMPECSASEWALGNGYMAVVGSVDSNYRALLQRRSFFCAESLAVDSRPPSCRTNGASCAALLRDASSIRRLWVSVIVANWK